MTIATFSLPIDIPWHRIAFSPDMMDIVACDRVLPLRWRSSVAIFDYQPPDDQQQLDGFIVSYLKVACTITGYQPDNQQIRIRERLNRSGWTKYEFSSPNVNLTDMVDTYHACYGAMLEVVVAPAETEAVQLEDYPYFADFDPKKRELYEQVTDTGEMMSRSLDDVGVRLGQTTSQSHEVKDSVSLGASISAAPFKGGPGASAGVSHTTTDLNQRTTENLRTTDAQRENRETLSHTTQLSQMYHQLNSYHLGTNRAAFFVSPRPHVVQSTDPDGTPLTFVDGPRQLEGIQEFMLVVVRPKNQEHICVEAYLETAHRVQTTIAVTEDKQSSLLQFPRLDKNEPTAIMTPKSYTGSITIETIAQRTTRFNPPSIGFVVDTNDPRSSPGWGGFQIITEDSSGIFNRKIDIQPGYVLVTAEITYRYTPGNSRDDLNQDSFYALEGTVFWKKDVSNAVLDNTLLITGRAACSCPLDLSNALSIEKDLSVVFEKKLPQITRQPDRKGEAMSIYDANRLGATIHREMFQSLSSADRYPRGMVSLLDTQLVSGALAAQLRDADTSLNPRLTDWSGIQENLLRQVTTYAPAITRMQLLQMPLAQQVEKFGLSFAEAVELRRVLADLPEPVGPPPVPERQLILVPDLAGLQLEEARAALLSAKLAFGEVEVVDSPLPNNVVIGQDPQSGTEVDAETVVKLQTSSGLSVRLPDVRNLPLREAMCQIHEAGLLSEPTVEGAVRPDTVVSSMKPGPRSWVTPHSQITLHMGSQRRTE